MRSDQYRFSFDVPVSAEEAFAWHERPGAFFRLRPPWQKIRVLEQHGTIHDGDGVRIAFKAGFGERVWAARHTDYVEGRQFKDVQIEGPFAEWEHLHKFEPLDTDRCRIEDTIDYVLPKGIFARLISKRAIRRALNRTFTYRKSVTQGDLSLHKTFAHKPRLKIGVTGASGLVGRELCAFLSTGGHEVVRLKRKGGIIPDWNPNELEGLDAVIHLAGENVASKRWTRKRMHQIRASRVQGTENLVKALLKAENPPKVFVGASGIGFYGDTGQGSADESSPKGEGFLADVAREWEAAAAPLKEQGIRVVHGRISAVLSPRGGVLGRLIPIFRKGLGGVMGKGDQLMSWISIDDLLGSLYTLLMQDDLEGPFNLASPHPVTNREFTKALGKMVHRPTFMGMPAPVARVILGKMGKELVLASCHAAPVKLEKAGYFFRQPTLPEALHHLLGKPLTGR